MDDPLLAGGVEVARILRQAGYEAYFAGGCVRDTLLGKTPKDYDIATNATPEQVAGLFKRTLMIGAAFGVVKVLFGKGREYELATYRADGDYSDGRRPDRVAYSKSAKEDVERRDFTINALLMDPETREVIDYVGGRADIATHLIRAVGDAERRFAEDRLRMLRAVRFSARLGFDIEAKTLRAVQLHADQIHVVSVERIVVELDGIWNSPRPASGFAQLVATGLLAGLGERLPIPPDRVEPITQRLERLGLAGPDRAHLAWALLLADLPIDRIDQVARSLKLSRERLQILERAVRARPALEGMVAIPLGVRRRLLVEGGPFHRAFQESLLGDHPSVKAWDEMELELERDPLPKGPLVTGEDLKQLGLRPGPEFKRILGAIDDAVYAREIKTREQALEQAKALASNPGS